MARLAGGKDMLLEPQVDMQEAEDYAALWDVDDGATTRPCCTATTFRIDILATPRSPWNRSAARVLYTSLVPEGERNPDVLKDVESAFFMRIKTLKKEYKKLQASSEVRLTVARIARRNARKYLVCATRTLIKGTCLKNSIAISATTQHRTTHSAVLWSSCRFSNHAALYAFMGNRGMYFFPMLNFGDAVL